MGANQELVSPAAGPLVLSLSESRDSTTSASLKPPPLPETEAPPSSISRRHDLDALRATAMLLGIVLHAALAYVTFEFWPVHDPQTHVAFDVLQSALHGFRMPLFFMVSGFFTAMLWRKRGLRALVKHRAKRILLPLAILLIPIQILTFVLVSLSIDNDKLALSAAEEEGLVCLTSRENDVDMLKQLLDMGADPNAIDSAHELPALNWAALNGSLEAAELLIENGANVRVKTKFDQSTPLSHAVFAGHPDLVELFVKNGAEVNVLNGYSTTPMDSAFAPVEILQAVAAELKLELDFDNLEENRAAAVAILEKAGGRRVTDLAQTAPQPDANPEPKPEAAEPEAETADRSFTEAYREFVSWPGFYFPMIFGHLWFLYFLCIILVFFLLYALAASRLNWRGPPKWLFCSPAVFLWLVPLTMIPQWFNGLIFPVFGPDTSATFFPLPHTLLLYGIFFFFGAAYYDCNDAEGRLGRFWWLSLPIALLVVFPLGLIAIYEPRNEWLRSFIPAEHVRLFGVFIQALYAWLMTFGLMGLFRKICRRENKTIRYLSDSSYWLYLIHLPLLFPIQAMLVPLDISPFIKMPIVCLVVTGVLLLSYRYLVRYTILGTLLNGKRVRPEN